jgi:hypothetical protein
MLQNSIKKTYFLVVWSFGHPNGLKMLNKGPQMGGMYVLMSKPENMPITKSLGPFC